MKIKMPILDNNDNSIESESPYYYLFQLIILRIAIAKRLNR